MDSLSEIGGTPLLGGLHDFPILIVYEVKHRLNMILNVNDIKEQSDFFFFLTFYRYLVGQQLDTS